MHSILLLSLALLPQAADASAIRVEPERAELAGNFARLQLRVSGVGEQDLTRAVKYAASNPAVLDVSPRGEVRPLQNGTAEVLIEHAGSTLRVPVTVRGIVERPAVGFKQDVIPILSKAGCNMGACHAAQYGQGGLMLSVFGFAPEKDYLNLTRDQLGRRVSPSRPADSLILRKPTLETPHGGGRRFAVGSHEYQILEAWVAAGTPGPNAKEPEVVDLRVTPAERLYQVGESQQLRLLARYSDGSEQDVTHRAKFDSLSDGVALVTPTGYLTTVGAGQAGIMVRYDGQAKVSIVVVPFARDVDLSAFRPNNFVDELVLARWKRLGLKPAALSSDGEFLRRAFLDAIGTLPPPERIQAFLESKEPNKREALIDELLGLTGDPKRDIYVNEWSAYWSLKWGDLLRNNRRGLGDGGMWALHNWVRASLRENKPVHQFVREIIMAQGSVYENGPANYYRISRTAPDLAETTAQIFLGVRLQCAKCHHHPFEVYGQSDYYGLAAFFTRIGTKPSNEFGALGGDSVVMVTSTGEINHPRTNQVMKPAPLLGKPIDPSNLRDRRKALAEWLAAPDNTLFARNIVNRFWAYYMGTGLVEQIDDMRATNPPSNPELLDALAADFVKNGYDLRKLMRAIMVSRTYQLSSVPPAESASDTRFYTHYNVKRLPAEVLLDAIDFATGTREKFVGIPLGTRAIELPDPNYTSYFLDTMGRPARATTCECERTGEPNLGQVLHITNGDLINRKLTDPAGRIAKLIARKATPEEAVADLFQATLSRTPTAKEIAAGRDVIARAPNLKEGLEDLLWALCNSREFLFNH